MTTTHTDALSELERRRQALAPEALAGDQAAVDELERIEAELAAEQRREELATLAETETAERERIAIEQEQERQQAEWRKSQGEQEGARDVALAKVERLLAQICGAIGDALAHDAEAHRFFALQKPPGELHSWARLHGPLGMRLGYAIAQAGVREVDYFPPSGSKPLVAGETMLTNADLPPDLLTLDDSETEGFPEFSEAVKKGGGMAVCTVCNHPQLAEITAALERSETLRSLEARYGVTRSALSRHTRHRHPEKGVH